MTWHHIVPFAVHSKSPEIIKYIVRSILGKNDFVYILRIISENQHIDEETVDLLLSSNLPQKYKDNLINKTHDKNI